MLLLSGHFGCDHAKMLGLGLMWCMLLNKHFFLLFMHNVYAQILFCATASSLFSTQPALNKRGAVYRLPRHHHCPLDVRGRVQRHLL